MFSYLGEHFPELVIVGMGIFALVLLAVSVEDAAKSKHLH